MKRMGYFLLALVLALQLVPALKASAAVSTYTGGLLDGLSLKSAATVNSPSFVSVTELTDNNTATFRNISTNVAWYTFSTPQSITALVVNNYDTIYTAKVEFYDINNVKIGEYTPVTNNGEESLPRTLDNVSTVVLKPGSGSRNGYLYVREFNVYGTPTAAPEVPAINYTTAGNKVAEIRWSSSGGKWYNLKRSTTAAGPFVTVADSVTGTVYKDTAVTNGVTYYYVVSAKNEGYESQNSNIVSVTPNASKYNRGLLDQLSMNAGPTLGNATSTLREFTDNSVATFKNLGTGTIAWFTFQTPQTISALIVDNYNDLYTAKVEFYDVNNVKIGEYTPVTNDGMESLPTPLADVATVVLRAAPNSSNGYLYVREFNVFETPVTVPAVPAINYTSSGDKYSEIAWTSTGAKWYNIKRSTSPAGPFLNIATDYTGTVYKDRTGTNGTTYYYVVSANNEAGESANSNIATSQPTATRYTGGLLDQLPMKRGPSFGSQTATVREITDNNVNTFLNFGTNVAWYTFQSPQDISALIVNNYTTGYTTKVEFYDADNNKISEYVPVTNNGVESLPKTVTGVTHVVLRAGPGSTSGYLYLREFNVFGVPPAAPNAPVITFSGGADKVAEIDWSSTAAKWYTVKRSSSASGPFTTIATQITGLIYKDTSVVNGTTYYYVVTASNEAGESAASNVASATPRASKYTGGLLDLAPIQIGSALGTTASVARELTDNNTATNKAAGTSVAWYKFSTPKDIIAVIINNYSGTSKLEFYDKYNVKLGEYTPTANDTVESLAAPITGVYSVVLRSSNLNVREFNVFGTDTPRPVLSAAAGNGQVALNWTAVTNATGYIINRSETSGGPYSRIDTVTGATYYLDTGVTNGTTYYYVVIAQLGTNESAPSDEAAATPGLEKPQNLVAQGGVNLVTLNWDAVTDASGYTVKRSTAAGGPYTKLADVTGSTTYSDTQVTGGTTYYYVVTAQFEAAESDPSNEASAVPTIEMTAPANLKATGGDSKVTLRWDVVQGASGYLVKRSTTAGGNYSDLANVPASQNTYVDTTAVNGTTYYYVVVALYGSLEGPYSNEAHAKPAAGGEDPGDPGDPGDRALLNIMLNTGEVKEYDLSMTEVNAFINWYNSYVPGQGPVTFAINKHNNNKGPFKERKDYIIFDKIITFEVNQYSIDE